MKTNIMKNGWKMVAVQLTAGLAALAASPAPSAAQVPSFLTGHVRTIGPAGHSLAARLDEARHNASGGAYFTAHLFESQHKIHCNGDGMIVEQYSVQSRGTTIHIQARNRSEDLGITTSDDRDTPSPAAILLFHDSAGAIVDASILDPERSYEFDDTPVFWLGQSNNDESMDVIEDAFAATAGEHLKNTLLFLASCQTGAKGYAFLKRTATGEENASVRESAIFWIGNCRDDSSLDDLLAIFRQEKNDRVRKHIVFAIQLNDSREATERLIDIARNGTDREVRESAVFWLGQKASAECVKALKDIVDDSNDPSGLKDQAVFAISQLPKDKSVPMLIEIARKNASLSVRKKAIFWLGQTGDEAALDFIEDILLKSGDRSN